jgi:hypothetical protein
MNLQSVLKKTAKGVEEIETRRHKLEQKLRTLLIVVNGKATGADLVKQFEQIGDMRPGLEQLLAGGFVEEAAPGMGAAEFRDIRVQLSHALTDVLGPAGDAITLQLEECKNLDQLRAFVESRRGALEGALGPRAAKFFTKAKALLS